MNNLEWIPYIIIMIGLHLAGKKNLPIGWLIQFIGCVLFSILGAYFHIWGIMIANVFFAFIGISNYVKLKSKT